VPKGEALAHVPEEVIRQSLSMGSLAGPLKMVSYEKEPAKCAIQFKESVTSQQKPGKVILKKY
jgi:hypothetical protein